MNRMAKRASTPTRTMEKGFNLFILRRRRPHLCNVREKIRENGTKFGRG
tara:strand:- start:1398 stop:1544 length:147 start_codon:yes stop_codon:yes gene_type:complete